MSDPQYMAWLDLETTGTNQFSDEILEIGIVVTDLDLNALAVLSQVVHPSPLAEAQMSNTVREMHTTNGLLDACRFGKEIEVVDSECSEWLKKECGATHVILAGSGVAHFDRRFLAELMPLTEKRFTYWSLDVGVLRRAMRYAGVSLPENPNEAKPHRALDDARLHLDEYRQWKTMLGGLR